MLFRLNSVVIIKEDDGMYILCLPDNSTLGFFKKDEHSFLIKKMYQIGLTENEFHCLPGTFKQVILELGLYYIDSGSVPTRTESFFNCLQYSLFEPYSITGIIGMQILVLGSGGVGSTLIYQLVQLGFKNITVLDYDIVETHDLNKSHVFVKADLGKLKTEQLKSKVYEGFGVHLNTINLEITSDNYHIIEQILYQFKYDLIVNAVDPDPKHKFELNKIAFKANTPILFGAYSYHKALIGPFIIPGRSFCLEGHYQNIMGDRDNIINLKTIKGIKSSYLAYPSICFVTNSVSNLLIREILMYFNNKITHLVSFNNIYVFDSILLSSINIGFTCCNCQICKN